MQNKQPDADNPTIERLWAVDNIRFPKSRVQGIESWLYFSLQKQQTAHKAITDRAGGERSKKDAQERPQMWIPGTKGSEGIK